MPAIEYSRPKYRRIRYQSSICTFEVVYQCRLVRCTMCCARYLRPAGDQYGSKIRQKDKTYRNFTKAATERTLHCWRDTVLLESTRIRFQAIPLIVRVPHQSGALEICCHGDIAVVLGSSDDDVEDARGVMPTGGWSDKMIACTDTPDIEVNKSAEIPSIFQGRPAVFGPIGLPKERRHMLNRGDRYALAVSLTGRGGDKLRRALCEVQCM